MIVYKLVTREEGGRRVSLMASGKNQIEYRVGEASHPPVGVLYAFDSPKAAQVWMTAPDVELWIAEATEVAPTPYSGIVGCKSLKILEKISQGNHRPELVL